MGMKSTSFSRSKLGFVVDTDGSASGLNVNPNANMVLDVEAGSFWLGGKYVTITATTVTISAADGALDRIDVVHIDDAGATQVIAGTPAASPVPPNVRDDVLLLAQVTVAAGATSIATSAIQDLRDISFFTTSLSPPIGAIMAWHKTFANTPALPSGWVECAGQVLNDVDSVYHGQTIPSMNATNKSLKGSTTSGGSGTENFLPSHTHTFTGDSHTHSYNYHDYHSSGGTGNLIVSNTTQGSTSGAIAAATQTGTNAAASAGSATSYFVVVWIMRVK